MFSLHSLFPFKFSQLCPSSAGWDRHLVPAVALCWSLFQLSLSSWLLLDSTYIRAIHLAFALALVIFVMTCLGTFAFASLTQGYFIARNRWYEVPILLAICAIMFRPGFFAQVLGLGAGKHWLYLIGIGRWGLLYLLQRPRRDTPLADPVAI